MHESLLPHPQACLLDTSGVIRAVHNVDQSWMDQSLHAMLESSVSGLVHKQLGGQLQALLAAPHVGFAQALPSGVLLHGYWAGDGAVVAWSECVRTERSWLESLFERSPDALCWLVPIVEQGEVVDFRIEAASHQATSLCDHLLQGERYGDICRTHPQLGALQPVLETYRQGGGKDLGFTVEPPTRRAGVYFQRLIPADGGLVLLTRNVSAQLQAQQELADSENRLRLAAMTARMGIWEIDARTGRHHWSDEMYLLYAMPADTVVQMDAWMDCIHPKDRPHMQRRIQELQEVPQGIVEDSFRIVRPNGDVRHILSRAHGVWDIDGVLQRLIGVNLDQTEELHAIESIESQRQLLNGVINSLGEAVVALNPSGEVLFANRLARSMLRSPIAVGERPSILLGDWMDADQQPLVESPVVAALTKQCTIAYKPVAPCLDGEPLWMSIRVRPLSGEAGVVCTMRDIRAQEQGERERRELRRQLEQTERLRALGTLSGGLAHDINNMLTVVFAAGESILTEAPEHLIEDAMAIRDAAEQGHHLLKQLLTFSGQVARNRRMSHPAQIVETACRLFRHKLPAHITLTSSIDEDIEKVSIHVDEEEWVQSLLNLIQNASDAISADSDGRVWVRAWQERDDEDQPWVIFSVEDNGSGMTEEQQQRALEPFFTTKTLMRGTGLGLSMVHAIISGHGGTLLLDSAVGQGTTVQARIRGQHCQSRQSPTNATMKRSTPLDGQLVLLVDDHDIVLRSCARLLRLLGAGVEEFVNPIDALEQFRADPHRYTIALLDVNMPELDGPSLAAALRRIRPDVHVLLMTANPSAQNTGGWRVLAKPILPAELARIHVM